MPDLGRLVRAEPQLFLLAVHVGGATYEQTVAGRDPVDAMSRALRRKWIAELALSEKPMTFNLVDWSDD